MLNALEPGTVMPIHRHRNSSETVVLLRGSFRELFYDDDGSLTEDVLVKDGGTNKVLQVEKGRWHSLECLEPGTVIFEAKDGAYETLKDIDIIDLGCGSGNIGITLKKKIPNAKVSCIDISEEALIVAKENASSLQADITFIKSDMLDDIYSKFDVIISNPPYISPDEQIEDIVKNNEPNLALFADNNGLYFYEKILSTCEENLNEKFLIAFEIGMTQRDCVTELAHKYLNNVKIECKKDLSGKDRMIFIYNI